MISLNTLLTEELEHLAQTQGQEDLEEGFFTNLFAGLGLLLGSMTMGGVKLMKMDTQARQSIENAGKSSFGQALKNMTPSERDALYKHMESDVDKSGKYKVSINKGVAKKSKGSELQKAADAAKTTSLLKCFNDNKGIFVVKGNDIAVNAKGTVSADSTADAEQKQSSTATGSIAQWIRKIQPNATQMFFARNLSSEDFSDDQKQVLADVIKAAIKRTGKAKKGSTEYADYGGYVADAIGKQKTGINDIGAVFKQLGSNDSYMMATTLGRFTYQQNEDSSYTIHDKYDFSKGPSLTVTAEELEGKSYPAKVAYIMKKDKVHLYQAMRHISYLENPDNSKNNKLTVKVEIPAAMMAQNDGKDKEKAPSTTVTQPSDAPKSKKKPVDKKIDTVGASPVPGEEEKKKKRAPAKKKDAVPAEPANKKADSTEPSAATKNKNGEAPKSSTTVIRPAANKPDVKKGDNTSVIEPGHKTHTLKPVITMRNGKPHYKMKNGKPVIKLREMLKDLIQDIVSES